MSLVLEAAIGKNGPSARRWLSVLVCLRVKLEGQSHLISSKTLFHNTDLLQTNETFIAAYWTQPAISA